MVLSIAHSRLEWDNSKYINNQTLFFFPLKLYISIQLHEI